MDWGEQWEIVGTGSSGGGQGEVRKVRHRERGELGALKVMHGQHLRITGRRQRLVREVQALEQVAGTGVPRLLDANTQDVADVEVPLFLVQGWVEGRTLTAYTGGQPIPLDEALALTYQLCATVERVHAQGVVHRDIKPDNIIIDDAGQLFLVDFGISWIDIELLDEAQAPDFVTKVGEELGNRFLRLADLAPQGIKNDRRSDLTFVVGILFYLLTGTAPRVLRNERGLPPHEAHEHRFPESVRHDPRWPYLQRFFRVGFQSVIDYRYQTAAQVREGLDRIQPPPAVESSLRAAAARYEELIETETVRIRTEIQQGMMRVARELEQYLHDVSYAAKLQPVFNSAWAYFSGPMEVSSSFQVYRQGIQIPRVDTMHVIKVRDDDPSRLMATFRLSDTDDTYYEGPAADIDSLSEAVERRCEEMFAAVLRTLTQKVQETPP